MSGSESFGSGERYYAVLCPVTYKFVNQDQDTFLCSRCNLVSYSDRECLEWHDAPKHCEGEATGLCGLLAKLSKAAGGRNPLDKNPGSCLQLANIAKMILKRNLTQFESDMLMFPRLCGTCSSHIGATAGIVSCNRRCVLYCNQQCKDVDQEHQNNCLEMSRNIEDYIYERQNLKHFCDDDKNIAHFKLNWNLLSVIPKSMDDAIRTLDSSLTLETPRGRHVSSMLSSPLTCASAIINHFNFDQTSKERLTIHLVGSRKIERSSTWSILTSLLSNVKKIRLIFVGLECLSPESETTCNADKIEMVFIPPCSYEQYATSDDFQEPDIVCAFNCGFILYSSWNDSIPHMVRPSGVPLVFTEYYEQDCRANLDLVRSLVSNVATCQDATENYFRSFQSQRSPLVMWGRASQGRAPVISDNNFVAVVKRCT